MVKSDTVEKSIPRQGSSESVSRRVAEELHERVDQAAEKGEKFEHALHERGSKAKVKAHDLSEEMQEKARELNNGFKRVTREHPWAVMGGAVALGVLIGALSSRR